MPAAGSSLTIGLVMVGPYNDQGWSQANYDAVQYVTNKVAGTRMVYIDKANSAARRAERARLSRGAVVTLAEAPAGPFELELEYRVPGARSRQFSWRRRVRQPRPRHAGAVRHGDSGGVTGLAQNGR